MRDRAEEQGWLKTVPDEHAQSTVEKKFIGDVSLSPTPQPPPVRPPPPPPTGVIARTATKRIVTRAAPRVVARAVPTAIAAASADGPFPVGDVIAVGIVVVALVVEHGLAPEEVLVLGGGQAHRLTAAASAAAAPTSPAPAPTAAPVATGVKPRRYPNQTCEDDELDRLQKEKGNICNLKGGYAVNCSGDLRKPKFDTIPCSTVKLSILQRQACLAARWAVQDKCFGGKPDPRHEKPIDEQQQGLDNCELLKLKVCAPGHPMAGK